MASINLSELRNTRLLKSLLQEGKTVDLRDRSHTIARIVPVRIDEAPKDPDFAARRRKIFGKRQVPGSDIVISERGRF
jgi:antitoxin (DNA-binding transcriptional repressor) of toxin-antitoxin stability system